MADTERENWDESPKAVQEKEKKGGWAKLTPSLPAPVQTQRDAVKHFPLCCQGLSFPGVDPGSFHRLPVDWWVLSVVANLVGQILHPGRGLLQASKLHGAGLDLLQHCIYSAHLDLSPFL